MCLKAGLLLFSIACLISPDLLSSFLSSKKWSESSFSLALWYLVEHWAEINLGLTQLYMAWIVGITVVALAIYPYPCDGDLHDSEFSHLLLIFRSGLCV